MEKLQEIELTIKDENEDGVFAISLVDRPAIEENFIQLSKQQIELKVINEEKRIVVGFALIPEKRIFREMNGKQFNVFFTKETIAKTAELYMKKLNLNNVTTEHEKEVNGVSVIESWIVEDKKHDKSNIYNLGAKGGEWVVMMKVYNEDVYQEIKAGKYHGFSIEGVFDGMDNLSSKQDTDEDLINEIKDFLKTI